MAGHFHRLKIKEVRRETPSTVSIALDIPMKLKDAFSYKAGQYLTFKQTVDGEELRRSYSLCSSPEQNEWRVAVKTITGGKFSTYAGQSLQAGMELEVMEPMGNFFIPDYSGHHVAFAAGSGITPIISMVKSLLASGPSCRVTLFYGNKKQEEIIFENELKGLEEQYADRFTLFNVLSQEQIPGFGFGRLDTARLDTAALQGLDLLPVSAFYLCGPAEMIFSLKDKLVEYGVSEDKVHFELFTAPVAEESTEPAAPAKTRSETLTNTYILDGERFEVEVKNLDSTLLDMGLAQGIDLPFACQGGVCCTCRAKVESGKVDMRQNFSLSDSEVDEGFVLTCQSYSLGEDTILNYDA